MRSPTPPDTVDLSRSTQLKPGLLHRAIKTSRSIVLLDDRHVTLIASDTLSENCHQLALNDILGITILRTRAGRLGNIVLGTLAFIAILLGAVSIDPSNYAGLIMGTVIVAIILLFLLINTALGPTCRCYLRTAVQNAPVTATSRLKSARQLATQLTEAMRSAQAETLASMEARAAESTAATPDADTQSTAAALEDDAV